MKYIKQFENEWNAEHWNSIVQEGNNLHVHIWELANEMEAQVAGKSKHKVVMMEDRYIALVKKLLIGKVITFYCADCIEHKHTGLCEDVSFSSGDYPGGGYREDEPYDVFSVQFVHILLDGMEDSHNVEDEDIVVHLDVDPEVYINAKKYNL